MKVQIKTFTNHEMRCLEMKRFSSLKFGQFAWQKEFISSTNKDSVTIKKKKVYIYINDIPATINGKWPEGASHQLNRTPMQRCNRKTKKPPQFEDGYQHGGIVTGYVSWFHVPV